MKIPKPKYCDQNWLDMPVTECGRICQQCQKTITDFSKMNWSEIEELQIKNGNTLCGMYSTKQLEYWGKEPPNFKFRLKKTILVPTLLAYLNTTELAQAQNLKNFTITGRLLEKDSNTPIINAKLDLLQHKCFALSDIDGKFILTINDIKSDHIIDTLLISAHGFIAKKIPIDNATALKLENKKISLGNIEFSERVEYIEIARTAYGIPRPTFFGRIKWYFKKWLRKIN